MNHLRKSLFLLCCLVILSPVPVFAKHKGVPHDEHQDHAHDHQDHEHRSKHEEALIAKPNLDYPRLTRTREIDIALSAGGEPIIVEVLGMVCDFCAKSMNKTFGKREEVAAVYVNLDTKSLNLVLNDGYELADAEVTRLVTRAGFRLTSIRRGPDALGTAKP
ncbi:MAG: heavy-metal-associated domain-containing protein [Gammaproteobacteria bacterium]